MSEHTVKTSVQGTQRLVLILLIGTFLFICAVSLYSSAGWRSTDGQVFSFLMQRWPRYWTVTDVFLNCVAYIPLGLLLALWLLLNKSSPKVAVFSSVLIGGVISVSIEVLQNWLPARVPSNLDVWSNLGGTLIGALVAPKMVSYLHVVVDGWWARGRMLELRWLLLLTWLCAQWTSSVPVFGLGNLHGAFAWIPVFSFSPNSYALLEAVVVVAHATALHALLRGFSVSHNKDRPLFLGVALVWLLTGLAVHFSARIFFGGELSGLSLSVGTWVGGVFALALLCIVARCSRFSVISCAVVCLGFSVLMINLMPENPYLIQVGQVANDHFFNAKGATRLLGILWPFACLSFLCVSLFQK